MSTACAVHRLRRELPEPEDRERLLLLSSSSSDERRREELESELSSLERRRELPEEELELLEPEERRELLPELELLEPDERRDELEELEDEPELERLEPELEDPELEDPELDELGRRVDVVPLPDCRLREGVELELELEREVEEREEPLLGASVVLLGRCRLEELEEVEVLGWGVVRVEELLELELRLSVRGRVSVVVRRGSVAR